MKARSNSDNIMPYIQADAAFCMLNIYTDLKNTKYQNIYAISIPKNATVNMREKYYMINVYSPSIAFCRFLDQALV